MALYHAYSEVENSRTGVPMAGVRVVPVFPNTGEPGAGVAAPIYADKSETPFVPANTCLTDESGMYSFYIEPGSYNLDFFIGSQFIRRIEDAQFINPNTQFSDEFAAALNTATTAGLTAKALAGEAQAQVEMLQEALAQAEQAGLLLASDPKFGVRGGDYDDEAALNDWKNAVLNMNGRKGGLLPPFAAQSSAPLEWEEDWEGITLSGVPGLSCIRHDGPGVLKHGNWRNVTIENISFESRSTATDQSQGEALLWSRGKSLIDVTLRRLHFTAPYGNLNGWTEYGRNAEDGYTAIAERVTAEDLVFEDIGRQACTFMYRYDPANLSNIEYAKGIYFRRWTGRNLGVITDPNTGVQTTANYGMLLSFDGAFEDFDIAHFYGENCYDILIEVVETSRNGRLAYNRMKASPGRPVRLFALNNQGIAGVPRHSGIEITGNQTIGAQQAPCYIIGAERLHVHGNDVTQAGSTGQDYGALLMRDVVDSEFEKNRWTSDRKRIIHLEEGCARNTGVDEVWDHSSSLNADYAISFSDRRSTTQLTTDNVFLGTLRLAGTGVAANQIPFEGDGTYPAKAAPTGNAVRSKRSSRSVADMPRALAGALVEIALTDANYTFANQNALLIPAAGFRFQGSLTASRSVFMPAAMFTLGDLHVWNNTGQTLNFGTIESGATSEGIPAGRRAKVYYDSTTKNLRVQLFAATTEPTLTATGAYVSIATLTTSPRLDVQGRSSTAAGNVLKVRVDRTGTQTQPEAGIFIDWNGRQDNAIRGGRVVLMFGAFNAATTASTPDSIGYNGSPAAAVTSAVDGNGRLEYTITFPTNGGATVRLSGQAPSAASWAQLSASLAA